MSSVKPLPIEDLGVVDEHKEGEIDDDADALLYLKKCPEPSIILHLSKCPRYAFVVGGRIEQTKQNKKHRLSLHPSGQSCEHFLNCINKSIAKSAKLFIGMTSVQGHGDTCNIHLYPSPKMLKKKYGRGVAALIEIIGQTHLIEL